MLETQSPRWAREAGRLALTRGSTQATTTQSQSRERKWVMLVHHLLSSGDLVFSGLPITPLYLVFPLSPLSRWAAFPQSPPKGLHLPIGGASCPLRLFKQLSNQVIVFFKGLAYASVVSLYRECPYIGR